AIFELDFIQLVLALLLLWMFVPKLEDFWGTPRFLRFVAITSIAGAIVGTLVGLLTGRDVQIFGLTPFIYGAVVAFGVIYAKQPVMFSYYIKMTGRQLMWGLLAVIAVWVLFGGLWEKGASIAGGALTALVMTSRTYNPEVAWKRWRLARARAKLAVL